MSDFKNKLNKGLSDISSLKSKEYWKWSASAKIVVGLLSGLTVLGGGFAMLVIPTYQEKVNLIEKEEAIKKEYILKAKQSVNLELYKKQLEEITAASDTLLKQLPNKTEVEKLIIDINQSGISRGLRFELFRPGVEVVNDYYAELPISIEVVGDYASLGQFASDLSQLSRVVILKDISLGYQKGVFKMNATARTFRYLDQDEIDRQKEKVNKAKKGKRTRISKKEDE